MSDQYDPDKPIDLTHEETQSIIDWAVRTGAFIFLIEGMVETRPDDSEFIDSLSDGLALVIDSMPEVMHDRALEMTAESIRAAVEAESMIQQFRQEIDEL